MTKPSYEELRITKHSGSPQIADSARGGKSSNAAQESRPVRIQRRRSKGWKMPPNTVYVGRPAKWGNPYIPDSQHPIDLKQCVADYRSHWWRKNGRWLFDINPIEEMDVRELRGKNLACWCAVGSPCHADVLLNLANTAAEN